MELTLQLIVLKETWSQWMQPFRIQGVGNIPAMLLYTFIEEMA